MTSPAKSIRRPLTTGSLLRCLAAAGALALLCGCGQDAPVSLDAPARVLIDTLYMREVRTLRVDLDSTCEARFESEVSRIIDSLIPIRRAEEERLRRRIPIRQ